MSRLVLITTAVACGLAACASEGPRPTEQLTRAHTLVDQADKAQAQRYAAADIQRAHDELSQADSADRNGKFNEAKAFAESAAVDADVAAARTQAGEAQHAVHEVAQSNASVAQESERAGDAAASSSNPPPPPPPPPARLDSYPAAPPAPPPPPDSQATPH